ncbi:MAG: class I SAM-dependent methyltransferase [Planctomycetota bacterium]|jgi:SAM-dependent methyltransferase
MIDVVDFRRWLERARSMVDIYAYADTLSYAHARDKDVPVDYQNKYSLLQWLDRWSPQRAESVLSHDLKELRDDEADLAERMFVLYRDFGRTISTTREWYRSKGAIYETILDYRYLKEHLPQDFNVLDFGAGCGRHGLAFHLLQNRGLYVGMECVEVLYILQNAILSFAASRAFLEYFDFLLEGKPFPSPADLRPGTIVHMPSWESDALAPNTFDVIIACHVLDELPKGDMERFLGITDRCVRSGGVVYARGTLKNPGKSEMPRYHGLDVEARLVDMGFEAVVNDAYPTHAYNVLMWRRK